MPKKPLTEKQLQHKREKATAYYHALTPEQKAERAKKNKARRHAKKPPREKLSEEQLAANHKQSVKKWNTTNRKRLNKIVLDWRHRIRAEDPERYAATTARQEASRKLNMTPEKKARREATHKRCGVAYRQKNGKKIYVKTRQWVKDNPEKARTNAVRGSAKRRFLTAGNPAPGVSDSEWSDIKNLFGGVCAYCRLAPVTDCEHVLCRTRGGHHAPYNIVPSCQSCNNSKWAHLLSYWANCKAPIRIAARQSFLLSTMNSPPIDLNAIQCEEYIRDWLQL